MSVDTSCQILIIEEKPKRENTFWASYMVNSKWYNVLDGGDNSDTIDGASCPYQSCPKFVLYENCQFLQ